jgi:VWFA-related protein
MRMANSKYIRIALFVLLLTSVVPLIAQRNVIRSGVDLVVVPASVRDTKGESIYNLTADDFQIFEDGRRQEIRSFTADTLPLSVVLLIDTGTDGDSLSNIAASFRSLGTAFKDVDEVEIYRFDHIIDKLSGFTKGPIDFGKKLESIERIAEQQPNRPAPIPVLPGRGPGWLRRLLNFDNGVDYKNLNDPLSTSAMDLEKCEMERRKIIVVISDGQVSDGSNMLHKGPTEHSFERTRDQLVQDQIQVFSVAVGIARLEGSTSILHAYADATGGDVYSGKTQYDIEAAYSRITEQARRQYVFGYISNNEIQGSQPVMRKIEVKALADDVVVHYRKSYLQYPRSKR